MANFSNPLTTLRVLLNPRSSDAFSAEDAASYIFWTNIAIHEMPIIIMYFSGAMSLTFSSILLVNYFFVSYFAGACALGCEEVSKLPGEKTNQISVAVYSTLFMLTGAWPLIHFKIVAAAGIIGMMILPIYLVFGLSTIIHLFYTNPPKISDNLTLPQLTSAFIAERMLPKSTSIPHIASALVDNKNEGKAPSTST